MVGGEYMKEVCVIILFMVFGFIGCKTETSNVSKIDNNIELSIEPGNNWMGKMKIFIFSVNKTPQMAAWVENDRGDYLSTITVTNRSAKKNWRSAPKEGRLEALPVWNHKIQNNSTGENIDAVSTATSKGQVVVQIDNDLLTNGQEYNVYLEINHSFDYNETWPEETTGVNGQPSIIYHAQFIKGQANIINLVPIGYGSIDGSDGKITEGLSGLTTALEIIKGVYVKIK
jgi:hypothetical protein